MRCVEPWLPCASVRVETKEPLQAKPPKSGSSEGRRNESGRRATLRQQTSHILHLLALLSLGSNAHTAEICIYTYTNKHII